MLLLPPRATRTALLFPTTTRFRSAAAFFPRDAADEGGSQHAGVVEPQVASAPPPIAFRFIIDRARGAAVKTIIVVKTFRETAVECQYDIAIPRRAEEKDIRRRNAASVAIGKGDAGVEIGAGIDGGERREQRCAD